MYFQTNRMSSCWSLRSVYKETYHYMQKITICQFGTLNTLQKYLLQLSGLWDALAMLSMSNVLFFLPNAHIPQGGAYMMYTDTVTVS